MKVSYQRELYHSRMRCELEREESDYGYALQMCLRNSIPGLLPSNVELMDGRTYVCWDITSRNSLEELCGGRGLSLELLERVLRAVYTVMGKLDSYLISNGYLVLMPEHIYLDASGKNVGFICDYDEETGFQTGIQRLAEYILEKIDHKDREQMRLGYGLYRLAVQENFPREDFQILLFRKENREAEPVSGSSLFPGASRRDTEREDISRSRREYFTEEEPEDKGAGEAERQKLLDSFFMDDETESGGIQCCLPLFVLLAGLIVCGLEIFIYFRNGRHIHPGWLVFGVLVTLLCTGMISVVNYINNRGKNFVKEEVGTKQVSASGFPLTSETPTKPRTADTDSQICMTKEAIATDRVAESLMEESSLYGAEGETMVLQMSREQGEGGIQATLEPLGASGSKLVIPAGGAVLGKLPEAVDILLPSPAVSRIHARIIQEEEGYRVQDLNSRNGTCVNSRPLAGRQSVELKDQDELRFADLNYRFCLGGTKL